VPFVTREVTFSEPRNHVARIPFSWPSPLIVNEAETSPSFWILTYDASCPPRFTVACRTSPR
jgi:hypothetical protein